MERTQNRLSLMAFAAAACLVLVTAANGCSSTGGRDDDTDAGTTTTTDAGKKTDAGTKPDAGTQTNNDPHEGTVGSACTATNPFEQGDCDDTLRCSRGPVGSEPPDQAVFPLSACTKICETDADCGSNGTTPNTCQSVDGSGGDKICFRACDPLVLDSCGRASHTCTASGNGKGICTPRCDFAADVCPDGFACDTTTGQCQGKDYYEDCDPQTESICSISPVRACLGFQGTGAVCLGVCEQATDCPTGSVCGELKVTQNNQTVKFCTKKCGGTLDPQCPSNTKCGNIQGSAVSMCLPKAPAGTNAAYQECGDSAGACVDSADCLAFTAGGKQMCFTDCAKAGVTCPAGQQCAGTGGASKHCLQLCGQAGQAACPSGTTCSQGACLP